MAAHNHSWMLNIHGLLGLRELIQPSRAVSQVQFSDQPDHLLWRCTESGTVQSLLRRFHRMQSLEAYLALVGTGTTRGEGLLSACCP